MATVVHPLGRSRWAAAGTERGAERLAVGAVVVATVMLPLLEPTGPGNSGPVDVAIAGALVVTLLWAVATGHRLHLPYAVPVAILAAAGALSALLGEFPYEGLVALLQEVVLLAWCAAIANLARSPAALKTMLGAWSWSAIAWASVLVVAATAGWELAAPESGDGTRVALTFGNSNLAASYFVISLMVILASGRPRNVVLRAAGSIMVVVALVLTGSLAGFLGLVVALAVAAVVATFRRAGPAAATAVLVGLMVAGGIGAVAAARYDAAGTARSSQNVLLRTSLGRGPESAAERATLLEEQIELYTTGDLLGRGPASTKPTLESLQAPYAREAHNDYLAALIERGVIGAVGMVLLIGAVTMRAGGIVGPLVPGFGRSLATTAPLVGALVAAGVMAVSHEILHQRHLWALLGVVAAIYLWGRVPRTRELSR
jgi:O-antigen ligase